MDQDEQEQPLHLQVTLEARDYFRYYLDGIRMKIVIAAIVYAAVTVAFIWFFSFIGEESMMLKLSPLFLGFPAVGIVGQLLRAHAITRKYIAGLSESDKILNFTFDAASNGYDLARGESQSHVAWSSVRSASEKTRYFEVRFNKYDSFIIPKRFFNGASEENHLREILRSHLGSRARTTELSEV